MKTSIRQLISLAAVPALLATSLPSNAGIVYGTAARTQFEDYAATLGDTHETFNGFAAQTKLTTQIPGLTFRTTVDGTGFHAPPPGGSRGTPVNLEVNVICSLGNPFSTSCGSAPGSANRLIGGVRQGGVTDGQSVYEITFDTGQMRAGLTRTFFNTLMLTRFYSGATLLGEHQNTAIEEFVGFISDAANPITRIEMDGLFDVVPNFSPAGVYQVGYADDLFFGSTPLPTSNVPEPATWLLVLPALWAMRRRVVS
ncbi:hypothetical protein [Accumulibacter sp.]|uniref:hypothetical protein n=1 Tax=Accumulibacter sp. TaxID=2053492 RepID=UPI0025EEBD5E|nr:hypothetical protein [Accumulibacter sp.]MCP5228320.1 hypothetical protein [Accumulibacter sp.]